MDSNIIDPDQVMRLQVQTDFKVSELKNLKIFQHDADFRMKLEKLNISQKAAVKQILQNNVHVDQTRLRSVVNISSIHEKQRACNRNMERIIRMNWQYVVIQPNGDETAINDFDCMKI